MCVLSLISELLCGRISLLLIGSTLLLTSCEEDPAPEVFTPSIALDEYVMSTQLPVSDSIRVFASGDSSLLRKGELPVRINVAYPVNSFFEPGKGRLFAAPVILDNPTFPEDYREIQPENEQLESATQLYYFNPPGTFNRWYVVTWENGDSLYVSTPVRVKFFLSQTEFVTGIQHVDLSTPENPLFTWKPQKASDASYYQVVASTSSFITGVFVTDPSFRFYDTQEFEYTLTPDFVNPKLQVGTPYTTYVYAIDNEGWVSYRNQEGFLP